ncbi:MAG: hypothetical protein JWM74_2746 [Myxococcaceae bacterium]|jgi:hypothetical protein|nr:hypothetical protein [Myxococcaceae bacterium]
MLNRNFRRFAVAIFAFAAAGGLLYVGGVPRCPIALVTGVPCPACGSTRSMRALVHLDFDEVVRFNPIAPIAVLVLALIAARVLFLLVRTGDARDLGEGRVGRTLVRALTITAFVEIALWLLRFTGLFGGPVPV